MARIIKVLLLLAALTPLIYTPALIFPFMVGKAIFFRVIVELALVLFLIEIIRSRSFGKKAAQSLKHPLFLVAGLFVLSAALSFVFAENPFRAFWGEAERMEGLFGWLHYLVFLGITITVFERKDWFNFIKISLAGGFILFFYGLLQFLGITSFPFALTVTRRVDSYIGNSSFLATHYIFLLPLAAMIFLYSGKKSFWRYFSLLIGCLSAAGVFLTGTRGAVVALAAGIVFLAVYYRRMIFSNKKAALSAAVAALLLLGGFWLTKSNPVWQKVPGLGRIANTTLSHPSVRTRIISVGTAASAFKEKPLLGWGLENLEIPYNKHFNPSYAIYEAAWFDRSHNKILDVAVMQGLPGLLIYLALFGLIFFYLFREKERAIAVPLLVLFVMYFVQNLFVFDQVSSYVMFFASLGIVVCFTRREKTDLENNLPAFLPLQIASTLMILLIFYSLYAFNFVPYRQAKTFNATRHSGSAQALFNESDGFLYPYNFMQSAIRSELIDFLIKQNAFIDQSLNPLTDKALAAMEELVEREPQGVRSLIRLSEAYNDKGKSDSSFFLKSQDALKKAMDLAPSRQDVYHHYAYTMVLSGKKEEAIEVARKAVAIDPNVGRSHYVLSAILFLAAGGYSAEGEAELNKGFELGKLFFNEIDHGNLNTILSNVILYHVKQRNAEAVVKNAARMKDIAPDLAPELERIIDLSQKGQWNQLDALLKLKQ